MVKRWVERSVLRRVGVATGCPIEMGIEIPLSTIVFFLPLPVGEGWGEGLPDPAPNNFLSWNAQICRA